MPAIIQCKPGVLFSVIAPGGFRILGAVERCARAIGHDLMITSACDGEHSGPNDPHHRGEAYDIRTHGLTPVQANAVVAYLAQDLGSGFYAFVEATGTANEHIHVQVRKGTTYPPTP